MTRKILLLILLSLFLSSPAGAYNRCEDPNAKTCLLMEVDEDPLTDTSGNGNTAALKAAGEPNYATATPPNFVTDGYGGDSTAYYDWDGTDDYTIITAGDGSDFDPATSNFSVVAWVKSYDSDGGGSKWIYMAGDHDAADYHAFLYSDVSDSFRFIFNNGPGDTNADSGLDLRDSAWHHIAGVRTGAVSSDVYVDGVDRGNGSGGGLSSIEITTDLYLGSSTNPDGHAEIDMDEFAYFGIDISSTDINDIMDNGLVQAEEEAAFTPRVIMF